MSIEVQLQHPLADFELEVDFSIQANSVTALFGPSGAGKSTVINLIAGLQRPHHGRIEINGTVVEDTNNNISLSPQRRNIGYVFQQPRLFPHLNVEKNLLFGWRRASNRADKAEVDRLIDLLGIESLIHRKPIALSGGEKQRVALGRALLSNPALLLLDEPLAALDHKRRDEILPYIERIRSERQIPILYVSHSIDEVTRIADYLHIINRGSIVAEGSVSEVFSRIDLYPITGRFEAGAIIDGKISRHLPDLALSEIAFGKQTLTVPLVDASLGESIRVRVRARDIIIARSEPQGISANNILRGEILDIRVSDGPYADMQLQCGDARLIARITRHSADRLELAEGASVYAVIKSVTIDRRAIRN
ncbi:MAG: molybdenum ABC transporter ATP-binding protein [Gammaproteobacteria bacterium]